MTPQDSDQSPAPLQERSHPVDASRSPSQLALGSEQGPNEPPVNTVSSWPEISPKRNIKVATEPARLLHRFSESTLQLHADDNSPPDAKVALNTTSKDKDGPGGSQDFRGQESKPPPPTIGFDQSVHARSLISKGPQSDNKGGDGGRPNILSRLSRYLTSTSRTKSDIITAPRDSAYREDPFREFANTDLTPDISKKRVAPSKELLRSVRALIPGDQVCRDGGFFSLDDCPY